MAMTALPTDADTLAYELLAASGAADFAAGSAEPWVADVLAALVVATGTRRAIEVGGFQGRTSEALARALARCPWPTHLTVCEIDPTRATDVLERIGKLTLPTVRRDVVLSDSHVWLPALAAGSVDFAWLDGNHEQAHVAREIELLLPAMRPGGLICGHDVFGVCRLSEVFTHFGGYALDVPRLGPAGGIGLLQVPR
jgi:predicted O-methyltransferase YrrM